jgi:hypothetical protein
MRQSDKIQGIRRFNDNCVQHQVFDLMIPENEAEHMFLTAFVLDPYYKLNEQKDGDYGYNFQKPLHFKYPFEVIERTANDLRVFKQISMKVTCGMCFYLTCWNGIMSTEGRYHARHKIGCPLVLALRRFTYEELLQLNHTSTGTYTDDLSLPFYATFHREGAMENLVREVMFPMHNSYVLQTLLLANYLRYNVYTDENNCVEDMTEPSFDSGSDSDGEEINVFNPHQSLPPIFRFGIQRVCAPCMNQRCPFYGVCTVRGHYGNHVLYKHPGAIPPTVYMSCPRSDRCDEA